MSRFLLGLAAGLALAAAGLVATYCWLLRKLLQRFL